MCMDIRIRHYDALGMTYIDIYTDRSIECISFWGKLGFFGKRMTKKAKIADLSFCFEFQVVVAVVGFLWHS